MEKRLNEAGAQWQSTAPREITWLDLGDDSVAFHRPSGKTHFLNASSKYLITDLLREPMFLAEVVEAFGVVDGDSERLAQMNEMQTMLDRLEQLGFVERL